MSKSPWQSKVHSVSQDGNKGCGKMQEQIEKARDAAEEKRGSGTTTLNDKGSWVEAIPEPYYWRIRKGCMRCNRRFWTKEGYRGHYALKHILYI